MLREEGEGVWVWDKKCPISLCKPVKERIVGAV